MSPSHLTYTLVSYSRVRLLDCYVPGSKVLEDLRTERGRCDFTLGTFRRQCVLGGKRCSLDDLGLRAADKDAFCVLILERSKVIFGEGTFDCIVIVGVEQAPEVLHVVDILGSATHAAFWFLKVQ